MREESTSWHHAVFRYSVIGSEGVPGLERVRNSCKAERFVWRPIAILWWPMRHWIIAMLKRDTPDSVPSCDMGPEFIGLRNTDGSALNLER
jgi:hypothetical protein